MAINKDIIRDFYGRIIGTVETDTTTNRKTARDFYGRILGFYEPRTNSTTDFYGRVLAQGDCVSGLVWSNHEKEKSK